MRCSFSIFVLVPFFEGWELLNGCIRSLEHQSIPFRAVLVDDGSTAATHRQVAARVEGDERFVLLRRDKRGGPAAARDAGLRHIDETAASGIDVVVLVDGDDRLLRDTALETIRRAYVERRDLKMTLGSSMTQFGERVHEEAYRRWHFQCGLVRHLINWRGDHPRSFRIGHYRDSRASMRLRFPADTWLVGGTDIALLLPMLARCRPGEVLHLDTILYEYRWDRADGQTLGAKPQGRAEQYLGEFLARRSLLYTLWKTLRYPGRSLSVAQSALRKFLV